MRFLAAALFSISLAAIAVPARADDDAAICSQYSSATDAERTAACDRILAAPDAGARASSIAHVWKGKVLEKSHRYDAALHEFEAAMAADPSNWEPYVERGGIKQSRQDYAGALADYDEAVKRSPSDYDIYRLRGDARILNGDYDKAIADFNTALTRPKRGSWAMFGRGRAKLAKKDYDGAIADLTQEINTKPPWAYLVLAWRCRAYVGKGKVDAALADCNAAIQMHDYTPSAYDARGYVYIAQGNFDKAIEDFNTAISKNPNIATFYAGRGQAYEGKKDFDNARADYQVVVTRVQPLKASARDLEIQQVARARLGALPPPRRSGALPAPSRVALVIGNGGYRNVPALPNPAKDANAVAKALEGVGFKIVQLADDMPRDGFLQALRAFSQEAAKAEWAVVYYAGHGMELGGVNYLIPVDAKLTTDGAAATEAVSLELVIAAVSGAKTLRLVMLDACRDNPFAAKMQRSLGLRLVNKGLSDIEPDAGIMVVYATKHGETALDGNGDHSPFATAVISDIPKPGIEVRRLFDVVRDDVMAATNRRQQPFSYGSLPGSQEFYFVSK